MRCGVATPTEADAPTPTPTAEAVQLALVSKALAGRYRIDKVLGRGGMATVYLAMDEKHRRQVAVKVMRPELSAIGAERFNREVEIAGRLNHPHILPMHDSGEAEGHLYYVMPYVEGETLRDRMQREGALPVADALRLARELAEALAYAHRRGIVHRDIKPANILLNEGHALVADFGIARAVDDAGGEVLTRTGIAIGTPQYMAPEQAMGEKEVDGRADIYAAGAVLYEMLAGEPPFTGPTARTVLARSLTESPRSLEGVRDGLAPSIDAVVQKALARNPVDRFQGADELVAALDAARVDRSRGPGPAAASAKSAAVPVAGVGSSATGDRARWRSIAKRVAFAMVSAVVIWLVLVLLRPAPPTSSGSRAGNRVAVLPFRNEGSPGDEYFSDGMSDEVRSRLAQVSGLTVIGSGSASQYKGTTKKPHEIAGELGADYLLTGEVRRSGPEGTAQVQVTASLLDVRTGKVKWRGSFNTGVAGVFEVQSQVASKVAAAMGAVVSDGERARFAQRPTANTAAYQLYLKGRALKTYDAGSQRAAATLFEQVVALDSGFADAWSALSIAMSLLYSAGTPGAELRAREALDRAVALDPTSLQAHLAGAQYQVLVARNPLHARAEFDLALRAAPTDDEVLSSAAQADMMLGDYGSALAKYERAREIDPRSFVTLVGLARVYSRVGRLADAEHALTTALLARPGDLTVIRELAQWRVAQGKLAEARAGIRGVIDSGVPATDVVADFAGYEEAGWILDDPEQQLVLRLRPTAFDNYRDWWGQSLAIMHLQRGDTVLARAYADSALVAATHVDTVPGERTQSINALMLALTGKRKQAEAVEELALQLLPGSPARTSYDILMAVRVELVLGDQERVLDLLEESRRRGGYLTPDWLALDPTFRGLKGNPRFEKLLEK